SARSCRRLGIQRPRTSEASSTAWPTSSTRPPRAQPAEASTDRSTRVRLLDAGRPWLPAALCAAALATASSAAPVIAAPPIEAATAGGSVRALVIGIDHYQNPQTAPPLDGAVADARDLAET